jgi:hypothetical protein
VESRRASGLETLPIQKYPSAITTSVSLAKQINIGDIAEKEKIGSDRTFEGDRSANGDSERGANHAAGNYGDSALNSLRTRTN